MGRRILQGRNAPTHRPDLHRAGETIPQKNRSSRPGFEIFILLLVGASSISLVSAESGENSLIPLRLLFPPNPLRWASAGDLFSSTNRPTCLRYAEGASHMARENPLQSGFKSHSHKRPTFAFMGESGYTLGFRRKIAHKGSHGETRGVLDGGGITTLGAFCTVMNCGCPPRAG